MNNYPQIEAAWQTVQDAQAAISACFDRNEAGEYRHPLMVAHRKEMQSLWRECWPKRKFNWERAREAFPEVEEEWRKRGKALMEKLSEARDTATDALIELCADASVIVPPGDERRIKIVSESSYHTQGFGAAKYARAAAEMKAMKARYYGLTARVERRSEVWEFQGRPVTSVYYAAWAGVTELGEVILRHKPSVPLREQVKWAWKNGTNPRVFDPFLPHGYEEENGLDYFGNDLAGRKEA